MRHTRLRKVTGALAAGLLTVLTATATTAPADAAQSPQSARPSIVELPVSFAVRNTNNTAVACSSDGKNYTVRGTIVAPRAALANPKAATLFLHAVTWGKYYFNFKGVPNYDFARQLAQRGHTSVIVDRLGYGASDKPPGLATCFGSETDVAHQMVQALRSGKYRTQGTAPKFRKVAISGSSVGGMIANLEAGTFRDVDAVINQSWGDVAATPYTALGAFDVISRCLAGGDRGARPYYAAFFKNDRAGFYFNSATIDVRRAVPGLKADPCGQVLSIPAALAVDTALVSTINVPVQVVFGGADNVFGPQPLATDQQVARYLSSPSVTRSLIPQASHYPLIEKNHLRVVSEVDKFLKKNGM